MPNDDVELMKLSLQALDDMLMDDSLMPVHFAQLRVIRSHLSRIDIRPPYVPRSQRVLGWKTVREALEDQAEDRGELAPGDRLTECRPSKTSE